MVDQYDSPRRETEALIAAIWGEPAAAPTSARPDPETRTRQNAALATAMRAYLQQYLTEAADEMPETWRDRPKPS